MLALHVLEENYMFLLSAAIAAFAHIATRARSLSPEGDDRTVCETTSSPFRRFLCKATATISATRGCKVTTVRRKKREPGRRSVLGLSSLTLHQQTSPPPLQFAAANEDWFRPPETNRQQCP